MYCVKAGSFVYKPHSGHDFTYTLTLKLPFPHNSNLVCSPCGSIPPRSCCTTQITVRPEKPGKGKKHPDYLWEAERGSVSKCPRSAQNDSELWTLFFGAGGKWNGPPRSWQPDKKVEGGRKKKLKKRESCFAVRSGMRGPPSWAGREKWFVLHASRRSRDAELLLCTLLLIHIFNCCAEICLLIT